MVENSLEIAPHMGEEKQEISSNRQNDVFPAVSLDDIFAKYPRPQLDQDLNTSVMACDNLAKAERNQEDSQRIASILQRLNGGSLYRDHDVLTTLTTSVDARNTYSDSYRLSNAALITSQVTFYYITGDKLMILVPNRVCTSASSNLFEKD